MDVSPERLVEQANERFQLQDVVDPTGYRPGGRPAAPPAPIM